MYIAKWPHNLYKFLFNSLGVEETVGLLCFHVEKRNNEDKLDSGGSFGASIHYKRGLYARNSCLQNKELVIDLFLRALFGIVSFRL